MKRWATSQTDLRTVTDNVRRHHSMADLLCLAGDPPSLEGEQKEEMAPPPAPTTCAHTVTVVCKWTNRLTDHV